MSATSDYLAGAWYEAHYIWSYNGLDFYIAFEDEDPEAATLAVISTKEHEK